MGRCSTRDVRKLLLDAGERTFGRLGFNGSSVQDVTEEAGVPKGSFYNHFQSKEALGVAVLDQFWADATCGRLNGLRDTALPPLGRLRRYFETGATDIAGQGFACGCLAANMAAEMTDHSPAISEQLAIIFAGWHRRVADCLGEARAAGELASGVDPDLLAGFVLDAWQGAVLRSRIEKGDRPLRQFNTMLFTQLLCHPA